MAKVMISLPDELLKRLDEAAKQRKTTRSGLIATALDREVNRLTDEEFEQIVRESKARFAKYGGSFDAADAIRWERDYGHTSDRR
jgi:predicted transcriptional regulator